VFPVGAEWKRMIRILFSLVPAGVVNYATVLYSTIKIETDRQQTIPCAPITQNKVCSW
jgi:hypothetical protein